MKFQDVINPEDAQEYIGNPALNLGLNRDELVKLALMIADAEGYEESEELLLNVSNLDIEDCGLMYPSLVDKIIAERV